MPPSPEGPIATRILRKLRQIKQSKVIDFQAYRDGAKSAADLQKTVATDQELAELHPAFAVYAYMQGQIAVMAEQIAALPAVRKLADWIAKAEDDYLPEGPPLSPLTRSHFTYWALFDAAMGADLETLGTCTIAVWRALDVPPSFLALAQTMQESRMGVYRVEENHRDGTVTLRDLATATVTRCVSSSGWEGTAGELWLARTFPPPTPTSSLSVVVTTPYLLRRASERDWLSYLDRVLDTAKSDEERHFRLKHKVDWSEFIFAGFANSVEGAIILFGIPDQPTSLPHYSARGGFGSIFSS